MKASGAPAARGAPESAEQVLDSCVETLFSRLPPGWTAERRTTSGGERPGIDLVLTVRAPDPDSAQIELFVEARRLVERRDVAAMAEQLTAATAGRPNAVGVVASRYLAPAVRELLASRGLGYVDATGNLAVLAARPGLYVRDRGADSDPWRGPGRPRGTLKGAPASRVVRALLDLPGPLRARELATASGASVGATYRVLEYLEREAVVTRDESLVSLPSWRALLELWSRDYGFQRSNATTTFNAPRGLPMLLQSMAQTSLAQYAVTGTVAVPEWADTTQAPVRTVQAYVSSSRAAADAWDLRPSEAGVNVILAEPASDVVFQRSHKTLGGLVVAAPTQVAVDLLTGPGREPEEARELLDWMERNESRWR